MTSKPMTATRSSSSAAVSRVPDTQEPSGFWNAPAERGKISYHEPYRALVRSTHSGYSAEGETQSRSGVRAMTWRTCQEVPAESRSATGAEVSRMPFRASVSRRRSSSDSSDIATARSRTRPPSVSMRSTSTPAAIFTSASCAHVPYGSDQPSTRKRQAPGASGTTQPS